MQSRHNCLVIVTSSAIDCGVISRMYIERVRQEVKCEDRRFFFQIMPYNNLIDSARRFRWNYLFTVTLLHYWWNKWRIMHELSWIMIFFCSRVRWFDNDFHRWWSHEWKSLANHVTTDQKIVIHGNECIIFFLCTILCHEQTVPPKRIVDR